tara:strand:+ start:936 stop:1457 length:522 start_codon:yes stop_codon:yes gene_type:complete
MIVESKTVRIRYVEESDAEFILKLRLDERYNQFLSSVNPDVKTQRDWIRRYKVDEADNKQFYFIIERHDGVPCGTVRVYDLQDDSFCWGSWILNEDKTRYSAIESAFLVYEFGFDVLGFTQSHFDVRKGNEKVISFHEKMGALKTHESDVDYFFKISKEAVLSAKEKLKDKLL